MIAKHIEKQDGVQSSFHNLVKYITNDQGNVNRVGQSWFRNCVAEDGDFDMAIAEIQGIQNLNRRATEKTYHLLLSFDKDEKPTVEQIKKIEAEICKVLGFEEHQRICVIHNDTEHMHLHIAINKINSQTLKAYTPYYDHKTLSKLAKEITRREFQKNNEQDNTKYEKRNTHADDYEFKTGYKSFYTLLKEQVEEIKNCNSWNELHKYLAEKGIELKKRGNGLVFQSNGIHIKASSIDRSFSLHNLEQRYGTFENNPYKINQQAGYQYHESNGKFAEIDIQKFREYKKNGYELAKKDLNTKIQKIISSGKLVKTLILADDDMDEGTKRLLMMLNALATKNEIDTAKQKSKEKQHRMMSLRGFLKELKNDNVESDASNINYQPYKYKVQNSLYQFVENSFQKLKTFGSDEVYTFISDYAEEIYKRVTDYEKLLKMKLSAQKKQTEEQQKQKQESMQDQPTEQKSNKHRGR